MSKGNITADTLAATTQAVHDDSKEVQDEETPILESPTAPISLDTKEKEEIDTVANNSTTLTDHFTPNIQEFRNTQSLAAWIPAISTPPAPTIPSLDPRRTPLLILSLLEDLSPSEFPPPRPSSAPPKLQHAFARYYNPDDAERCRIEIAQRVSLECLFEKHRDDDPAAPYCLEQERIMRNAAEAESIETAKQDALHSPD